ncbi:hypothetical protein XBP1_270030 [Xenorhabdus bovienii str. puntauvense]|uniref:Uncharacterized protein n=2 Tax=Xenorhabdus bovienii TaxID=40576 RepID=A0A0B6X742_XENBV|nr:hypothetical protein XBFFR1_1910069 [Xenorhabdus bovienii str. feltiae France]CDG94544.1 hypothetical protein XBFFL1_770028 [Xenorhabdus bovienii str. feltiae Florida]CDG97490.1 hypothetical protein XBP1_270030 [Xenorhabdus bovienii str. puntauvense]CDM89727.1 protein of unknown function [Xenorhabdus bovienii]
MPPVLQKYCNAYLWVTYIKEEGAYYATHLWLFPTFQNHIYLTHIAFYWC